MFGYDCDCYVLLVGTKPNKVPVLLVTTGISAVLCFIYYLKSEAWVEKVFS